MLVDKASPMTKADIFPFTDDPVEAIWQARISVHHDGTVWWNGKPVTQAWVLSEYSKLLAAFAKAFEIAVEEADDENTK